MQKTADKPAVSSKARKSGGLNNRQKDTLWGYALIAIPFIGMIIFTLIPFGMSVYTSFTSWPMGQPIAKAKFVGLKNYIDAFKNPLFWKSLTNTFFYMIGIPIGLVISLILAAAMNRGTRYEKVFRVIYYVPVISSVVAITFVFQQIFNADVGVINEGLRFLGIKNPPNWMSHASYTKWVIIILSVWKGLGS
ncbi:MAG: sugar ABC transporter permease, partial [Parasporobacterium sp.]|nr:sugar ABC transporter permease [Parasporobacterium sp.]